MRLVDTIVKSSMGRLALHHLCTSYSVEVNRITLAALEDGLAGDPGRGAALLERLQTRGLVAPDAFAPVPQRTASDVVSIELEPISQCNLRCRHCYVRTSGDTMTEATFAAVLEGAARLGAVELAFNGGEPLLHERCLDWLERARRADLRAALPGPCATAAMPDVAAGTTTFIAVCRRVAPMAKLPSRSDIGTARIASSEIDAT